MAPQTISPTTFVRAFVFCFCSLRITLCHESSVYLEGFLSVYYSSTIWLNTALCTSWYSGLTTLGGGSVGGLELLPNATQGQSYDACTAYWIMYNIDQRQIHYEKLDSIMLVLMSQ